MGTSNIQGTFHVCRIAAGDYSPRLPQIRTCPIQASGSSASTFATWRKHCGPRARAEGGSVAADGWTPTRSGTPPGSDGWATYTRTALPHDGLATALERFRWSRSRRHGPEACGSVPAATPPPSG